MGTFRCLRGPLSRLASAKLRTSSELTKGFGNYFFRKFSRSGCGAGAFCGVIGSLLVGGEVGWSGEKNFLIVCRLAEAGREWRGWLGWVRWRYRWVGSRFALAWASINYQEWPLIGINLARASRFATLIVINFESLDAALSRLAAY